MSEIQASKMTLDEWRRVKKSTACTICGDSGNYEGYAHPLVGTETKKIRCGCSYPDAHITGHYPARTPKADHAAITTKLKG